MEQGGNQSLNVPDVWSSFSACQHLPLQTVRACQLPQKRVISRVCERAVLAFMFASGVFFSFSRNWSLFVFTLTFALFCSYFEMEMILI